MNKEKQKHAQSCKENSYLNIKCLACDDNGLDPVLLHHGDLLLLELLCRWVMGEMLSEVGEGGSGGKWRKWRRWTRRRKGRRRRR